MKIGKVWITIDLLEGSLGLPEEHHIIAVVPPDGEDIINRRITLLVEGPQMPEHPEGGVPLLCDLPYTPYGTE